MRTHLGPAAVAVGVALLYRGIVLAQLAAEPALLVPVLDGAAHLEWARGLLAGTWPGSEPFFRAPGYPFALAAGLLVTGGDPARVVALQLLGGAATAGLTALLAGRVGGRAAAWIAGVGAALYPPFAFFDAQLLVPVLAVPLTVGASLATVEAVGAGKRIRAVAATLWSAAAIVHPPLLVAAAFLPLSLARRGQRRAALSAAAIVLSLPFLVTARNAAVGDPVFIASQGGLNFYLGNAGSADGVAATFADAPSALGYGMVTAATRQAEEREGRPLRPSEVSSHYVRRTLGEIAADPGRWLGLVVKKAVLFWGTREIPNNHDPVLVAELVPALRWGPGWWLWAPLGIAGLALGRKREGVGVLAGVVAAVWLASVLFFVNARFRVPAAPILIAAGAGAAVAIGEGLRARRRDAAIALAAVVALGLLLRANPYGIPRGVWPMSYVLVADAERARGEPARALRWIERALAAEPGLYPARFAQAQLLRRAGRTGEALVSVDRLLEAVPRDAALRNERGVLLDLGGDPRAALAEYDSALALDPGLDAARVNRAAALARLGSEEEARTALLGFLRERPASAEAPRARELLGRLGR